MAASSISVSGTPQSVAARAGVIVSIAGRSSCQPIV
jgi:hypothetical protein